jgi:hypothetical protein
MFFALLVIGIAACGGRTTTVVETVVVDPAPTANTAALATAAPTATAQAMADASGGDGSTWPVGPVPSKEILESCDLVPENSETSDRFSFDWTMQDRFGLDHNENGVMDMPNTPAYVQNLRYDGERVAKFLVHLSSELGEGLISKSHKWCIDGPKEIDAWRGAGQADGQQISEWLEEGVYTVYQRLVATTAEGNEEVFLRKDTMVVEDILIVALGDSLASGEGNPEIARWDIKDIDDADKPSDEAVWGDSCDSLSFVTNRSQFECPILVNNNVDYGPYDERIRADFDHHRSHRSSISWPAQVAAEIERADPHTSVTFVHLAASGASIRDGILGSYDGVYEDPSKILDSSKPTTALLPIEPMSSQIKEMRRIVGDRQIDNVLLSVGANDVNFSQALREMAFHNEVTGFNTGRSPEKIIESVETGNWGDPDDVAGLNGLPNEYAKLANALHLAGVRNVSVSQYMDPSFGPSTTAQVSTTCRVMLDEGAPEWVEGLADYSVVTRLLFPASYLIPWSGSTEGHIEQHEIFELRKGMISPLQTELSIASTKHNWQLFDAHVTAWRTGGHGECANDPYEPSEKPVYIDNPFPDGWDSLDETSYGERWIRDQFESSAIQGSNQDDIDAISTKYTATVGTLHPNQFGHREFAKSAIDVISLPRGIDGIGAHAIHSRGGDGLCAPLPYDSFSLCKNALIGYGFDPQFYIEKYVDIELEFGHDPVKAFEHWLDFGRQEKRSGSPIYVPGLYLYIYEDLVKAFGQTNYRAVSDHWRDFGLDEGRRSSQAFDPEFYKSRYDDLSDLNNRSALLHWVNIGISEGRAGSYEFDPVYYLDSNPVLQAEYGVKGYEQALRYWVLTGIDAGQAGSAEFDPKHYLESHDDLIKAFGPGAYRSAINHWIGYGRDAGRTGATAGK